MRRMPCACGGRAPLAAFKATLNCNVGSRPRPHDLKKKNANSSIILFIQIEKPFFLVACIMEEW